MFARREKVLCMVCLRKIPIENDLLIPHRYIDSFFALHNIKCHGSGSLARVHVKLKQQYEQEKKDIQELY